MGDAWKHEIVISNEFLHHHATSVLNEHGSLRFLVASPLEGEHALELSERRRRGEAYAGITADSLNRALKDSYRGAEAWNFEATVRDGVVFGNQELGGRIEGFDIARFDERANLARLWAACFGRRPLRDGEALWKRFLYARPHLRTDAQEIERAARQGEGPDIEAVSPTILGEIQFGNWALAYRDVMKLLAASTELEVDLFVYITADGQLSERLSDGTVAFTKFRTILEDYASVIKVPTWLIGIDLAETTETTGA